MYQYMLSTGEYSDYSDTSIFHEKKFTTKEFVEFYNYIIREIGDQSGYFSYEKLAEEMCEKFGFVQFEIVTGIHSGYEEFTEIPLDKVGNEYEHFHLDDL